MTGPAASPRHHRRELRLGQPRAPHRVGAERLESLHQVLGGVGPALTEGPPEHRGSVLPGSGGVPWDAAFRAGVAGAATMRPTKVKGSTTLAADRAAAGTSAAQTAPARGPRPQPNGI